MDNGSQINVNEYNHEEGKLIASIKWLITRIYEDNIPDKLVELFYRSDDGNLCLCQSVAAGLINGSLYSQAASKILHDSSLVNQTHGSILRALSRAYEIEVRDYDGSLVTESSLVADNPIRLHTHLALIDSLMTAHMKSIISVERVVQAISEYTNVDKREEPVDCVDASLFWINKICLLVRDDVERRGTLLKSNSNNETSIPEMEDLYEDLCDGTCITTLVSFYRPNEIAITDICFNDPISLQDCRYNLSLLQHFCENFLPWNPFHFEIEDILYLHENLQPNINAFLSDLFYFFEPIETVPDFIPGPTTTEKLFMQNSGIPGLRSENIIRRPLNPPRVKNNRLQVNDRDRTYSISSQDSLLTDKSVEKAYHLHNISSPTSFDVIAGRFQPQNETGNMMENHKGDSASINAIRLAMHQRRKEYEQKQSLENTLTEAERLKAGKNAFFKLVKTNEPINHNGSMPETITRPDMLQLSSRDNNNATSIQTPSREEILSAQVQTLQEEIQSLKLMNQNQGMSHAISQPLINHEMVYGSTASLRQPMHPPPPPQEQQMYAMPYAYKNSPRMYDQYNYTLPPQMPQQYNYPIMNETRPQMPYPYHGMSSSMHEQYFRNPTPYDNQYYDSYRQSMPQNTNTFCLHETNASESRLDPSLELNKDLTNWGLTYRSQNNEVKKWKAFNSEHDLTVNKAENLKQDEDTEIKTNINIQSPKKEKIEEIVVNEKPQDNILEKSATGFEIKAEGIPDKMTPEMQAKRDALYANLLKRKEKIADKVEEKQKQEMLRKQHEQLRQELNEQRKIEQEIRRQKLLDDYKRRKAEAESPSSTQTTPQRGHSQPPSLAMTKSQSNVSDFKLRTLHRPSRAKSTAADENLTPRIHVPATAEPTLKLYGKRTQKSNRALIVNALQYSIFPGAVSVNQKTKVQESLAQSDSKHFLVLFRDNKCQYRGLYTWDSQSDTAYKIHGTGPKLVKETMMNMMYKYDSGSKKFSQIPSKHLSPTIDGFTVYDQFWLKPKIPHSGVGNEAM